MTLAPPNSRGGSQPELPLILGPSPVDSDPAMSITAGNPDSQDIVVIEGAADQANSMLRVFADGVNLLDVKEFGTTIGIAGVASDNAPPLIVKDKNGTTRLRAGAVSQGLELVVADGEPIAVFRDDSVHTVFTVYGVGSGELVDVQVYAVGDIGMVIYGIAAQTADFLQLWDHLHKVFRVLAGGSPVTAQNAAPADGDLAAGECSLWFDKTNGASKLKIKGKSADGTVVTGQVNLT